jgi:hypothetical protein
LAGLQLLPFQPQTWFLASQIVSTFAQIGTNLSKLHIAK